MGARPRRTEGPAASRRPSSPSSCRLSCPSCRPCRCPRPCRPCLLPVALLAGLLLVFLTGLFLVLLPLAEPRPATSISDSSATARSRTSLTALTTASRGPCQARHCFSAFPNSEPRPSAIEPRVSSAGWVDVFFFATVPPGSERDVRASPFILRRGRNGPSGPARGRRRRGARARGDRRCRRRSRRPTPCGRAGRRRAAPRPTAAFR